MTKAEIISEIATKTGIDRATTLSVIETFTDTIKEVVKKGDSVTLRGFGSFIRKTRAQKIGRNIKAKKSVVIPQHNIPAFKAAKTFANEVR